MQGPEEQFLRGLGVSRTVSRLRTRSRAALRLSCLTAPSRPSIRGGWKQSRRCVLRHTDVFALLVLTEEATNSAFVLLVYGQLEPRIDELSTKSTEEQQVNGLTDINLELELVRAVLDTIHNRL